MDSLRENISYLKQFIKRRETYIRFSPLGTFIAGFLFTGQYFVGNFFDLVISPKEMFLGICAVSILLVTVLSLRNAISKGEKAFPPSIRSVVVNLVVIIVSFFAILSLVGHSYLTGHGYSETVILACVFYGLLIIASRHNLPVYITYFGGIVFLVGVILSAGFLNSFIAEIGFLLFGIGHIGMAAFLKHNNDKDG